MIASSENTLTSNHSTVKKSLVSIGFAITGLILLFVSGLTAIYFFVQYEKNRDLILWQDKLTYLTQIEKKSIDSWFQEKITGLQYIAENPTLKLYISNISTPSSGHSNEISHNEQRNYKRYLKELLIIKAYELGFFTPNDAELDFNQHLAFKDGLMIVDDTGKPIVSGNSDLSLPSNIIKSIKAGLFINPVHIVELIEPIDQQLRLGFVLPIYPIQENTNVHDTKAIAYLVAIKDIASQIKRLLNNHIFIHQHQEITLLRQNGEQILYLLSLPHTLPDIKRQLSIDTTNLAAAAALYQPNHFQQKQDYSGRPVLLYSSVLKDIPWTIMHSADQAYALSESQAHARFLYISFSVIFFAFICLFILIWRHSASVRYQRELVKMQEVNNKLNVSNHMQQLIIDNLSDYVMVLDSNQRLAYGNKALSNIFGLPTNAITGESIPSLLENSTAKHLKNVLDLEKPKNQLIAIDDEDGQILQTSYMSLADSGEELSMIVATDISNTLKEEKRKEKTMQQVVLMLTKVLEQHDSYSAQHSARVKAIALLLGKDLGFNENELFNLALSASLINIGKFYIPREILLKQEKLTEEEQKIIQGHILYTIKMLEDIDMEKKVIQAVSQSYERLDGSGYPKQSKAEKITLCARILAVSNAFVAMIYPRPWRQGMKQTEALDTLMKDSGYDKSIIIALYNIVENKGQIEL